MVNFNLDIPPGYPPLILTKISPFKSWTNITKWVHLAICSFIMHNVPVMSRNFNNKSKEAVRISLYKTWQFFIYDIQCSKVQILFKVDMNKILLLDMFNFLHLI